VGWAGIIGEVHGGAAISSDAARIDALSARHPREHPIAARPPLHQPLELRLLGLAARTHGASFVFGHRSKIRDH
jgi:hypothetical protein